MHDYASFPEQRQEKIKQQLTINGRVISVKLAKELGVSEHTIRRDLQELAKLGFCKKVYGGAVSHAPISVNFNERIEIDSQSKKNIGAKCADLFTDGTCVFLDGGSTNLAIASAINLDKTLTLVTNAPAIAIELLKRANCEVILIGGKISKNNGASVGITSLLQVENMYFDLCVMGACALDINEGLTVFEYEDAEFKKKLLQQSSSVLVALTKNKINSVARHKVADCSEINSIVFEAGTPDNMLQPFRDKNIEIFIADDS